MHVPSIYVLDVLVLPNGEYELVDEDDLMYALQNKQISKKQYHEAYIIAHQLMIEIEDNFQKYKIRLCVVIIKSIIKHRK